MRTPTAPIRPTDEITQLRRCMGDLVSLLGLPDTWAGRDAATIAGALSDAIMGMLDLDLVFAQLSAPGLGEPLELVRVAPWRKLPGEEGEVGQLLRDQIGPDPRTWSTVEQISLEDGDLSLAAVPLGRRGRFGVLVAGSGRAGFPTPAERLVLGVASNQATIGLEEARTRARQKRETLRLDRRMAERTRELVMANEQLRRNVAWHRREEDRLRRSEAVLAEAQRVSLTGSFAWRVATGEVTWSDQLYRIVGLDPGTPVTLERILSRIHPEDLTSLSEAVTRARREEGDFEHEHRLELPDESIKHVRIVAHAMQDADGGLEYTGAVQDVTERRTSDVALNKARADLTHVARVTSLGTLTASIAHEVNQPLSGITTNASTCLRMLLADPANVEGAKETVSRTIRDARRASEVIARLRRLFARTDMTPEPVDLNEAVREVLALSVGELQRGQIGLRTELDESVRPVTGNRVQLQQVVLNLLRNAADAMCEVDDRPRTLLIWTEPEGDEAVRLSVRDTGVGIAPDTSGLFEAFYTTKSGGMGIGLSVSRTIIESHHGRIWACPNDHGPGATFSFSLPCGKVSP